MTDNGSAYRSKAFRAVDLDQPRHTCFHPANSGCSGSWRPFPQGPIRQPRRLAPRVSGSSGACRRTQGANPESRGTARNGDPRVLRLCFDCASERHAPRVCCSDIGSRCDQAKATASGVKRSFAPRQEVLPVKDTRIPCGVKQMLELRCVALRYGERGTCSLSDDGPTPASCRKGPRMDAGGTDGLSAFSVRAWGAAVREGPAGPRRSRGPDQHFNLEAICGCEFATDTAIGDRRHNRLLQLAVAGSALLRIDRAGWPSSRGMRRHPLERIYELHKPIN
jgi:hypothetical protein